MRSRTCSPKKRSSGRTLPQRHRGTEKFFQRETLQENLLCVSVPLWPTSVIVVLGLTTVLSGQSQPSSLAPPGMAVVPAGEYWMGRTRLWLMDEIGWQLRDRADDRPVHRIVLNAFAIDAHEVTNA